MDPFVKARAAADSLSRRIGDASLAGNALVMGILNVTPDSFSTEGVSWRLRPRWPMPGRWPRRRGHHRHRRGIDPAGLHPGGCGGGMGAA